MAKIVPVILLGPPGSGKGTQAKILSANNSFCLHISTGDLFRAEVKSESPLGKEVKEILASGKLVSDSVTDNVFRSQTLKLINEKKPKFLLLDGYPRTGAQAESFVKFWSENKNIFENFVTVEFVLDENEVVSRISNRLVNPRSGRVYHLLHNPPKKPGLCDEDGGPLEKRADDDESVVRKRYKIYSDQRDSIVKALDQYFPHKKLSAEGSMESISQSLKSAIGFGV